MDKARRWDIFCVIVDNYGDIGVCWRLARQLAAEHGLRVRLWVDDLAAFRRIWPEIKTGVDTQVCRQVEVRRLAAPFPIVEVADVVIEAFACALPPSYLAAMAQRTEKPRWINLEYLSAEDWVSECHGLASPSPSLPLTKHFFFPGFAPRTGGVLMEKDLAATRQSFQRDGRAQAAFWQALGVPPPAAGESRFSLFCYPRTPAAALFACWQAQPAPVSCLVPDGCAAEDVAAFFAGTAAVPGRAVTRGSLSVRILPYLEQDRYDRLLWACDGNFVRGEDSFVRAQWAERPLVWQPYPQADGAHLRKLDAFLELYVRDLPADAAVALADFWRAWSRGEDFGAAWPHFWAQRDLLERHAGDWAGRLRQNGDLAANLLRFCADPV